MKFSVCVPHLNDYLALWFTIHSIQLTASENFGPEDFEIIICDNNSKEPVRTKVEKLFSDRNVWNPYKHRVISHERQGVDQARMAAAHEAKGEYLVFCDSHVLFNRDFFKTAINYMSQHSEVGILHCGLSWNGYNKRKRGTAYRLQLDTRFWGDWVDHVFETPSLVGSSGLATFIVRRKEFLELRGMNPNFIEYGGAEVYIDLKYWMFDYKVVFHPDLHVVHSGHNRDYHWDMGTLWVNFAICAYVIGGEEYLMKKYHYSVEKEPHMKRRFAQLCRKARKLGQEERDWIVTNSKYTLAEILEMFKRENVFY